MNIEISNCNNIDYAKINIHDNKLNIKFAPNGTGKTTIAKAIFYTIHPEDPNEPLKNLIPCKMKPSNPKNNIPQITGLQNIQNILCFNEDYLRRIVFQKEELVEESFNIFIKTDRYDKIKKNIERLVCGIKEKFTDNKELEDLINDIKILLEAFAKTKTGYRKSGVVSKAVSIAHKTQNIPQELQGYTPFIQNTQTVTTWIQWQTQGCSFLDLSDSCPFCTSQTKDKKKQIKKVGEEYDKNSIKALVHLKEILLKLNKYFRPETASELDRITNFPDALEDDQIKKLLDCITSEIDYFLAQLEVLKTISSFQFDKDDNVADKLGSYVIQNLHHLNSEETQKIIEPMNDAIGNLVTRAKGLEKEIGMQRTEINKRIRNHEKDINEFLTYAGYKYKVVIAGEAEDAKLKLQHLDHDEHIEGGAQYLSFGERNAFALVLFMYECLSKKPDLIILDDPISSFDQNKKYAILEKLFRQPTEQCLKNKTVILFTHDIEPIIDTKKALSGKFKDTTLASFLKLSNGVITEQNISEADIMTFAQICKKILKSPKTHYLIKLIYLRRYFEVIEPDGHAYQVLSNVFKRDKVDAIDKRKDKGSKLDADSFQKGTEEIQKLLYNFSYDNARDDLGDKKKLKTLYSETSNGFEKLQLFRFYVELKKEDSVVQKFVNETYHIENEFICQLDPTVFDIIPEYIIVECNKIINYHDD